MVLILPGTLSMKPAMTAIFEVEVGFAVLKVIAGTAKATTSESTERLVIGIDFVGAVDAGVNLASLEIDLSNPATSTAVSPVLKLKSLVEILCDGECAAVFDVGSAEMDLSIPASLADLTTVVKLNRTVAFVSKLIDCTLGGKMDE